MNKPLQPGLRIHQDKAHDGDFSRTLKRGRVMCSFGRATEDVGVAFG